ncbi:hypothetical protein KEM48_008690 [Puccinia striiformis f. sp. tritici PST-130]|nr:hypothetical protein KEM48_008690 [Puccinia striiformis f. sp. tritici PST-130]
MTRDMAYFIPVASRRRQALSPSRNPMSVQNHVPASAVLITPQVLCAKHQSCQLDLPEQQQRLPSTTFLSSDPEACRAPRLPITPPSKMDSSSQTTYFSFPSYESHFVNEIQAEEPIPATPSPFYMALEPLVDVSTEAYPIIQRGSYRKAETQLLQLLAAANLASLSQESALVYQCSESSSSCASSITSTRAPSLIESIKSWWRFA